MEGTLAGFTAGAKVGPYEILALEGSGGMGEVFRAKDTRLNRTVAIKVMRGPHSDRYLREARAISALNHPHICALFDIGTHEGTSYLVLEFIEGKRLTGPLPPAEAVGLGIQICAALEAAHRKGITHRDLKPANILITRRGVKLLDFGLAEVKGERPSALHVDDTPTETLTEAQVMGTPQYMAPELLEGKDADRRSDIFALGCVLYEMLTGRKAFPGNSASSVATAILARDPEPMGELPGDLEWVVATCLRKDPDERWQTSHDVGLQLERIRNGSAGSPAATRRKWMPAAAVLAGLSIAAVGLWAGWSGKWNSASQEVVQFQVWPEEGTRFTSFHATVPTAQLAVSPDGKYLVFVASRQDTPLLWLRKLSDSKAVALAGTEGAIYPFWSPDSKIIGFFAQNKLKRIDAAGGPVTLLADVSIDPRGGAWMPDQTIVFSPSNRQGIWRVPAAGGPSEPVECSIGYYGMFPYPLPDGKRILFAVRNQDPSKRGIYTGPVRGGTAVKLVSSEMSGVYSAPGYLLYPSDGMLLGRKFESGAMQLEEDPFFAGPAAAPSNGAPSFSVSTTGVLARGEPLIPSGYMTWFTRAGVEEETIGGLGDYSDFRVAPDGRRVLVTLTEREGGSPKIWLHDQHRELMSRQTMEAFIVASPVWSPKGDYYIYRSNRGGIMNLRKRELASGQDTEVFSPSQLQGQGDSGNFIPADFSADGKHLIYTTAGSAGYDVYTLPLEGGSLPRKLAATEHSEMHPAISPDGRWLAYTSDESGRYQVYVQSFETRDRREQVSAEGGAEPRWSADGRELFYLADSQMLMAVPFRNGEPGKPAALFQAKTPNIVTPYRQRYVPSPDGRRFLVYTVDTSRRPKPITVTLNWRALINR